ncbi:unnamed protein product, partial [Durusdinium trenchii]
QEWRVRSLVKSSYLGWNPQGWRAFMREMQWWMSALDLEGTKKYNLAARWLLRQSGIVRQRGEEFSPADLEYQREITATDPVTEEVVVITPEDPLAGLHKLLRALEGINGKTVLDKRGDLRNAFYLELRRRPGERLAEFCTRFRSAVADLKAEGVVLPSSELGWFLKQKLGLDAIRVQLLETALQGKESYEETELEVLRLFRDLRVEEEEPHEETHEDEPDEQYSLEEVLQAEAEILATELEEAVDDGIGPDIIQDVEETVESAAEALLTMREARSKLAEVRKDRGYGKASTGADSPKGKMANKKSKLPCFDCNQLGHWAGDPECKNPGAGLGRKSPKKHPKSVKVVETMNTEHVVADPTLLPAVDGNGALAVSCVSRNLKLSDVFHAPNSKEVHAVHTGLTADKRLVGALDSACNRTVTGSEWLHSFLRCLEHAPQAVRDLVQSSPEHEVFRFGDGGTQVSSTRWRIPVMLGDTVLCVWVSEVPVPSLGLLLGRDFLESVGANMSFANRVIQFEYLKCHALPLKQLAAGHYMLRLLPSHWAVLWLTMLAAKAAHSAGREDNETRQHVRWTRMVARLAARQAWHLWGVFLWLVRRPSMRFVPLPYPSVSTVKQWRLQGKTQEENGIVPKGTFQKAELWQAWTVSNMSDCIWLRNRMGIRYAFLEDPILMGMLAAKSAKGLTARVKKESIAEAVEKAHQSQMQGTADQEARAMIGPRGGLPTLRSDLLRLAALLHVHIGEKDTVPVIKEKLKPMVEALKGRTPAADSRASSSTAQPPPVRPTSAPVQKPAAKPPPRAIQSFTPQPCEVLHQTRSMAALEQLLKQVSAAVEQIKDQPYSMQTQGTMPQQYSLEQASDVSMNDLDAEAQRQLMEDAALSMEAVYEEKLEAQYGEWGMLELTPEQKERAWEKHRRDQLSRFGVETAKINQALQTEFENEMNSFVNDEVFVHAIDFTTCLKPLNSSVNLEEILEKGRILMRFALELAAIQHEAGRHYILENPQPSAAWKEPDMVKFLDEFEAKVANFHQCQFGLRSLRGGLHRKATRVASSSFPVVALLDGRVCDRSHGHDPVIGGRVVTERAGHYPGPLARAFVVGMERQFNSEVAPRASEVLAVSHGEDADEDGESSGIYFPDSETDEEDGTKTPNAKIPASVRAAIARLHDNTGHRSNRRLARALAISGAPAAAIQAAKEHKCSICAERAPPKSQRVGSLPQPRDVSDQVHIDLLEAEDCKGTKYYIIHATDFCTRFQMSELLERKTAGAVVNFLKTRWWPIFGPMRTLVADQGLLVAVEQGSEGNTGANAYISFKGQLTKCSLEHVRRASPMEQIVAGDWEEAIREAVASALRDMTRSGLPARPQEVHDQPIPEESEWPPVPISESESPSTESPDGEPLPAHPAFPTVGETPPVKPRERQPSSDLPPVHPREMVNALQSGTEASVSRLPSHSGVMASRLTTPMTRQNTPMAAPPLFAGASSSSAGVLGAQIERARLLEKRPAEMETEELRSLASSQAAFEQPVGQPGGEPELHDTLVVSKEDVMSVLEQGDKVHPLIKLYCEACVDRANPLDAQVHDHGTWDGRWGLPSRSEFLARKKLGLMWPCGADELHEANAVQAARKEYYWRAMTPDQKAAFRVAAEAGWSVWETNEAVEVLDDKTSQRIRADLKAKKEDCKILTPRWVFTDKHDGLRTKENNLGLKANARLVVPGFKDVLSFSLRKDAPTASRLSQHLVFSYVASYFKDHGWRLMSCDVKSAFLKGDPYMDGTRELFIENTKGLHGEPQLPFGASCLARVRKGVFGLSDAPRQWYLRLHRALTELGWERNVMDAACWMLWDAERKTLLGICLSHVDDLLVGGGETARNSILSLEKVLGFGSVEHNSFNYCGKRISQDLTSGVVTVTMKEYHENVRPAVVPLHRRADPNALLTSSEQKQLRALLGSLQWLVAQARIDQGFALSTLQGEQPQTVGTLLRCNLLLKQMKLTASFGLTFRPMCLEDAGVMVITDSSLGNVTKEGSTIGSVEKRVFSQSSYMVLLADKKLMSGEEGQFCLLDGRSHRLSRVCRSTYAAELLGAEEAFDCDQFIRGVLASFRGFPMENRFVESIMDLVPLSVVVDAKDVHDKCNSDSTCGAQKSLAFAVAWMRSVLRRPRTSLRWTATENMIVDGGTKFMDMHHMRTILNRGRWSVKFNVDFIKGKSKGTKGKPAAALSEGNLPGEPLPVSHPVFPYLHQLGDRPGWHFDGDLAINVARDAKSFRSPAPRCDVKKFHLRSTFGRFDHEAGASEWRALEEEVDLNQLANLQQLIGAT